MGWTPDFETRVDARDVRIGVAGLGYVGLPTAAGFHAAGFPVRGADSDRARVEAVLAGEDPAGSLDGGRPPAPGERWSASDDVSDLAGCDVVLVTVPTPVTADLKPDLSHVEGVGGRLFGALPRGDRTIVVLESTVYPGVTRRVWEPLLHEHGLVEGVDVELAYCPERLNPGDPEHGVRQVPRVVGAGDPRVGQGLVRLYGILTSGAVRHVGAIEVAEAAKVVENVQRDLNVALMNELAMLFPRLGIDLEDVLEAASSKWNFHRYKPGLGVGGHCIPVDPYYLMQRALEVGVPTELIGAARAVNRSMPQHAAKAVLELLARREIAPADARVLLLGWTYKPGVSDVRETPARPLARALLENGVQVSCWDPHLALEAVESEPVRFLAGLEEARDFDCAVLVTAHPEVLELDWKALRGRARTPLLFDGRRVLQLERLAAIGWDAHAIGRPS